MKITATQVPRKLCILNDNNGDAPPVGTVVTLREVITTRSRFEEVTHLAGEDWNMDRTAQLFLVEDEDGEQWVVEPAWTEAA